MGQTLKYLENGAPTVLNGSAGLGILEWGGNGPQQAGLENRHMVDESDFCFEGLEW